MALRVRVVRSVPADSDSRSDSGRAADSLEQRRSWAAYCGRLLNEIGSREATNAKKAYAGQPCQLGANFVDVMKPASSY